MTWSDNDLTKLTGGTPAAAGNVIDGYAQRDGSPHVNYIDANGHIHELYRGADPTTQWVHNDLTSLAVELDTAFFSAVDGYAESDGSQHVDYIDASSHVHELSRRPGPTAQWVDNDLHNLANSPQAGSSPVNGYLQADGSQHVNYIDQLGHIHELYRNPAAAAQWADNDLTNLAGGTPANPDAATGTVLVGYAGSDGSQHVNFIDPSGHVHELHKSPNPAVQWVDNDLTKLAAGTPAAAGFALDAYVEGDGSRHVNFIDPSGHVHELYRSTDAAAQWVNNDLTKLAGGTPASPTASGNVLAGYVQGDGAQHIDFFDQDGHVHELCRTPDAAAQWVDHDLTKLAGGTPANRLAIAGYAGSGGSQHVIYVDARGDVHELYTRPSN